MDGFYFPAGNLPYPPLCRDLGSIPENTAAEWSMAMVVVVVVATVVPEEERHHVMAYLFFVFFFLLSRAPHIEGKANRTDPDQQAPHGTPSQTSNNMFPLATHPPLPLLPSPAAILSIPLPLAGSYVDVDEQQAASRQYVVFILYVTKRGEHEITLLLPCMDAFIRHDFPFHTTCTGIYHAFFKLFYPPKRPHGSSDHS